MKKIIVAILLLIPILVILTIDAGGRLIASALVDIPAESVVIKREGEAMNSDKIDIEDYGSGSKKYTLFSEVFPGIATDKMIWSTTDPSVAEVIPSESKKNAVDVMIKDHGSVDVICTSEKNESVSARMTLYVGGRTPSRITVSGADGAALGEISLPKYGVKPLMAKVVPASSVSTQKIVWSTSNQAVATVDDNGVLKGISEGTCTLTAAVSANGKTVNADLSVSVYGCALLKERVVYASGDRLDVSPYLAYPGSTVQGGSEVDLSALRSFGEKQVTVQFEGRTETLTVVKLDSRKTLLIENLAFLKESVLSSFIALGTSNIILKATAADGSSPKVTWVSSREDTVRFDQTGRLFAVGSGEAEIYPYADGYVSEKVTVRVTNHVEDFRLAESPLDDKVGLMQERVFGNLTYRNGVYEKTYRLRIASTYPSGVGAEAFTFESSDPAVARVDSQGTVTFADDVQGKKVTITATAFDQNGRPVSSGYTFRLVNGVNVGVQPRSAPSATDTDFSLYNDFREVCYGGKTKNVVLHSDVYYPSREAGGEPIINAAVSIYGNGKKLDGQHFVHSVEDDDMLLLWNFETFTDMPETLEVGLYNLNLQATQPTTDDSQSAFEELSKKGGGAFSAQGKYPEGKHEARFIIKGCLFQYAYSHINYSNGSLTLDGCIFRNNPACSVVQQQSSFGVADLKIKNCIFSNTIAPIGITCGNFDDILTRFSGGSGGDLPIRFGKFEIEGNIYVYNWKKLEEVQMNLLPQNLENENANTLVGTFNNLLADVIQESFRLSSKDNLYEDPNGDVWLNFSFLVLGIWANMDPSFPGAEEGSGLKVTFDPDGYRAIEVKAYRAPSVGSAKMAIAKRFGMDLRKNLTYHVVARDSEGRFNTLPGETYTIGRETYSRLRGE